MPERLLTSSQLARRLSVSVRTVQRWRAEKIITPEWVTAGGQARWDEARVREQVRQLLESEQSED